MPSRREPMVAALVGWTLFVWTTRIGNVWRDRALDAGEKLGRTGLALSFTVLAGVVIVAFVQRRGWLARAVLVLAVWTVAVWAERSVGIATGHHDGAFIAVHLILASVSTALATVAVLRTRAGAAPDLSPASGHR